MNESLQQATSSIFLLKTCIMFGTKYGLDVDAILETIFFNKELLRDDQKRIPIALINQLWDAIAKEIGKPLLGLKYGEHLAKQTEGHVIFVIMKNSETLQKAINSFIRFHVLLTDVVKPELTIKNGKACITIKNLKTKQISQEFADAVLGLIGTILRAITNNEIHFEDVCINHSNPEGDDEYIRVFGTKPLFESDKNCLVFEESILYRTFSLTQQDFSSQLQDYAVQLENKLYASEKYSDKILTLLDRYILKGEECSIKNIADTFNMSTRYLQNKLKQEGFTFQKLLDKARMDVAIRYLKNEEVMLCDIAFLLGYSEQSSFNHAFKKWTGSSPRDYKEMISTTKHK